MLTPLVIALVVGYLLGSLPFGYLVARSKGVNIFEVGSKNPGATNVGRVMGKGWGRLVLVLDALKGAVAVALWKFVLFKSAVGSEEQDLNQWTPIAGLLGALLGHSFSCFTKFRGGKGVATGAGGFLVLFPLGGLIALGVWAIVAGIARYVSVASILAAISLPISGWFLRESAVLIGVAAAVAAFVVIRHRPNIARLLAGTESKIGQKAATPKT